MSHLSGFLEQLPAGGSYSAWFGPLAGDPWVLRDADVPHYAASTMKLSLLVAAYRAAEAGVLDLDRDVMVHDDFLSVAGGSFRVTRDYDNDDQPWDRLGSRVPLRWLARRAIVSSSNLATNLLLDEVGVAAVNATLADLGCEDSLVTRGIQDPASTARTGLTNLVTARDLATLLHALADGSAASADGCAEMLGVLEAQEIAHGLRAGLPAHVRIASKSGWVEGVSHDAALVRPARGEPFVLVVLTTSELSEGEGNEMLAGAAAAAWRDWEAR